MICTKCGESPTAYGGLCIECETLSPGEPENIEEALDRWVEGEKNPDNEPPAVSTSRRQENEDGD